MHPPERETVPSTAVVTPDLSVVVMTYNEAESLADVVGEICAELTGLDASHEVVLVNDGSNDGSASVSRRPSQRGRHVAASRFSGFRGRDAEAAGE